jgi:hypothetical protein
MRIAINKGTIAKKPVLYKKPEAIIRIGPSNIVPIAISGYL